MLSFLPGPLKGLLSFIFFCLNTIFFCVLIGFVAFFKVCIPIKAWRVFCTKILISFAECWAFLNSKASHIFLGTQWDISPLPAVSMDKSYLVLANHQSWVDIFVLTHVLNRKIPFMRFFIKKSLRWVPFLNVAWWALDYPFVNRYSREYLAKHPEKRGQDLATARRSCERFKDTSTSILNFVEGTRFKITKHKQSNSPYKYLLPPKTGGVYTVLEAMKEQLNSVFVVSIKYYGSSLSFVGLMTGKIKKIGVHVEEYQIPTQFLDSTTELNYEEVKKWLTELWEEADHKLAKMSLAAQS